MGASERAVALRRDAIQLAHASTIVLLARADQPLGFQAIERGVHRADRRVAAGSGLDFAAHLHPVRVLLQAEDGEHDDLFELAEELALRHFYKVESPRRKVK